MKSSTRIQRRLLPGLALALCLAGPGVAATTVCGMPVSDPGDPAGGGSDLSLASAIERPASMLTCAQGYMLEKCGDHESAHKVFDKCIAAGYPGAMIWKALLLEDGTGVEPNPEEAARLLHRAATSGDPAYAPIGKMHYATMLHLGRGVPRDEAAARQWFAAAAAEGSEEAREFLRSGYHTGYRDKQAMGAGIPTAAALAAGLTGDNASIRPAGGTPLAVAAAAARAVEVVAAGTPQQQLPPATPSVPPAAAPALPEMSGQRLAPAIAQAAAGSPASLWLALSLLLVVAVGVVRQSAGSRQALFSKLAK